MLHCNMLYIIHLYKLLFRDRKEASIPCPHDGAGDAVCGPVWEQNDREAQQGQQCNEAVAWQPQTSWPWSWTGSWLRPPSPRQCHWHPKGHHHKILDLILKCSIQNRRRRISKQKNLAFLLDDWRRGEVIKGYFYCGGIPTAALEQLCLHRFYKSKQLTWDRIKQLITCMWLLTSLSCDCNSWKIWLERLTQT